VRLSGAIAVAALAASLGAGPTEARSARPAGTLDVTGLAIGMSVTSYRLEQGQRGGRHRAPQHSGGRLVVTVLLDDASRTLTTYKALGRAYPSAELRIALKPQSDEEATTLDYLVRPATVSDLEVAGRGGQATATLTLSFVTLIDKGGATKPPAPAPLPSPGPPATPPPVRGMKPEPGGVHPN
jgi:hypothetical protein